MRSPRGARRRRAGTAGSGPHNRSGHEHFRGAVGQDWLTPGDVAALRASGKLEATLDMSRLGECDVISICVPTPLGKTKDPDMSFVVTATESVAEALRPGQLVVLESTTYPGTTREVLLPTFEKRE